MAISRTDLEAMDRDQLIESVLELDRRLEDVEKTVDVAAESTWTVVDNVYGEYGQGRGSTRIEDDGPILQRLEALEETVTDLREENEELRGQLDEARNERQRIHRQRSKVVRRLANVEDDLGLEDEDVLALAEGGTDAVRESDLARLLEGGPKAVTKRPSPVYYRAEELARNFIRWGESHREHGEIVERTLASKRDDLLTRLQDKMDEPGLQWNQVYRAMQKVADLGPANIHMTERRGQGKMLVQRTDGGDDR